MKSAWAFASMLVVAALTAGSASASVTQEADLTMESLDAMHAEVVQEWTEADAKKFRQSLDVLFGNGDGWLNASEVESIVVATTEDMQGSTLPLVRVDDATAHITRVNVTVEGAEGDVNATAPVQLTHDVSLAFQGLEPAHTHVVSVSPHRNGSLSLAVPEGWEFAGSENLDTARTENGTISGLFAADVPVTVTVRDPSVPAPQEDRGEPTEDETDAGAGDESVPEESAEARDAASGTFADALRGLAASLVALGQAVVAPLPAWARGLAVAGVLGLAAGGGAWLVAKRGWEEERE